MSQDHAASGGDSFEARAWVLYDAANEVLDWLIDNGDHKPEPGFLAPELEAELPHDENDEPWYEDVWALKQALEAFNPPVKEEA